MFLDLELHHSNLCCCCSFFLLMAFKPFPGRIIALFCCFLGWFFSVLFFNSTSFRQIVKLLPVISHQSHLFLGNILPKALCLIVLLLPLGFLHSCLPLTIILETCFASHFCWTPWFKNPCFPLFVYSLILVEITLQEVSKERCTKGKFFWSSSCIKMSLNSLLIGGWM